MKLSAQFTASLCAAAHIATARTCSALAPQRCGASPAWPQKRTWNTGSTIWCSTLRARRISTSTAEVWVLDPLPFGDAAKGTIVSAPYAITNRHAQDTA
jgi:hypothetical protein